MTDYDQFNTNYNIFLLTRTKNYCFKKDLFQKKYINYYIHCNNKIKELEKENIKLLPENMILSKMSIEHIVRMLKLSEEELYEIKCKILLVVQFRSKMKVKYEFHFVKCQIKCT